MWRKAGEPGLLASLQHYDQQQCISEIQELNSE